MKKIERLKKDALKSCKIRGHTMGVFKHNDFYPNRIAISYCKVCNKYVQVNAKPMPNEIDIGGDAVALNCNPLQNII